MFSNHKKSNLNALSYVPNLDTSEATNTINLGLCHICAVGPGSPSYVNSLEHGRGRVEVFSERRAGHTQPC